jgi:signal transduction histidine kinase/HAMP domain-containing protein
LGGQAQSKEVGGVWKDLTDNVNQLAANLTTQVRAISEAATAVTEGDLTRQVRMKASGEVAALMDTLNKMIRNLDETTRLNIEQDWLKTNRERFMRMLQGQRDLTTIANMILSELAPLVSAQHGAFYAMSSPSDDGEQVLELQAGYGLEERKRLPTSFRLGEGLVGQCAKEKKRILVTEVPDDYVRINSGLGAAAPLNIIVLPVLFEGSVRAVVELASFSPFKPTHQAFLDQLPESIGLVLNTIESNSLTENLLRQSQSLAEDLRSQQEELRDSNIDLERQAKLLAEKNVEAQAKNLEVEQSKQLLEEKAVQLAVSSKYKSEFIANMSHELRTPLNSLLMLAEQLEDNPEETMTETQVQFARVILASGRDLLALLNDILDLAKVESGTVTTVMTDLSMRQFRKAVLSEFEPVAKKKGLEFSIELSADSPLSIVTDPQRLGQVLRNLLANAFKFTEAGDDGWSSEVRTLADAPAVMAISVRDSGIGIESAQQRRIFEAFAQGDGTTARRFGGTGLGLSISRALLDLLGGEITLRSTPGDGSTFTIYLPVTRARTLVAEDLPVKLPAPRLDSAADVPRNVPSIEADHLPRLAIDDHRLAGAKVLVVDDDFRNVFAMTALLERGWAEVSAAESGADAIALLQGPSRINLVLMDIMMPEMDGYAAIRAIRALGLDDLTIIAVTGKVVAGERERCIAAGANDYVSKPVNTQSLLSVIEPWLFASELAL